MGDTRPVLLVGEGAEPLAESIVVNQIFIKSNVMQPNYDVFAWTNQPKTDKVTLGLFPCGELRVALNASVRACGRCYAGRLGNRRPNPLYL